MSITRTTCSAPPEAVWAVLANPDGYRGWVVGSKDIRDADPGFPAPGTRFHHTVGWGPLSIRDHSEVLAADPPSQLLLEVKARPLGRAKVEIWVSETPEGGSAISIAEWPVSLLSRIVHNPVADLLLHGRNVEALERLSRLAEGTDPIPETTRSRRATAQAG